MIYLHFIVNPISGKAKHLITEESLRTYFPTDKYRIVVEKSEYKKHAIGLTEAAIDKAPDAIIACGGDGTINEVASTLVGSSIPLGIIPVGSGNGLASNLNIPKDFKKAIQIILKAKTTPMDVGKVNEQCFFSNFGLGVDALIIKKYEDSKERTLSAYVKASIKSSFSFKPPKAIIKLEKQSLEMAAFFLFVSNSNEMGYGMTLTPKASLSDGLLDMVLVPNTNLLEKLYFATLVLLKATHLFKKQKYFQFKKVNISIPSKEEVDIQIDGEYQKLLTNSIEVSILPHALKVLTE